MSAIGMSSRERLQLRSHGESLKLNCLTRQAKRTSFRQTANVFDSKVHYGLQYLKTQERRTCLLTIGFCGYGFVA